MQSIELFNEVLQIKLPWKVKSVSIDKLSKQLDVHIGLDGEVQKSMFGFAKAKSMFGVGDKKTCPECHALLPESSKSETFSVQHMPVAGYSTYLHVPSPGAVESSQKDCVCMRPWVKVGTHSTPDLYQHVLSLSQQVSDRQTIATLAGITESEVNKIIMHAGVSNSATTTAKATPSSAVPDLSDLSWKLLINGELTIETKLVALSMLLQRVQSNYESSPSTESGIAGTKSLHKFFVRNERLLQKEIAVLRNSTTD